MKVLHFSRHFSRLSETFIYDYITELERQGEDNHIVTLNRVNEESRPFPKITVLDRPNFWHPRRLWHRALGVVGIKEPRTSYWPQIRERLETAVQNVNPDVIHAHFGPAGALIAPVGRFLNVPVVVSFHGYDAFELPKRHLWSTEYPRMFENVAAVTAVSNMMANHLSDLGVNTKKINVVRVGKKIENYSYRDPSLPIRDWISVGRLVEKKGFSDCVAAFDQYLVRFPESTLTIIGGGEQLEFLQKQVKDKGLENNVTLRGQIAHEEVKKEFIRADGFILCSKESEAGDKEGVPTVLMEAQATGLPTVATRHSGIPEVIPEDNHDLLSDEGDTEALADILSCISKQSQRELTKIAQRGRKKVEEEFNLRREVEKIRNLYRNHVLG